MGSPFSPIPYDVVITGIIPYLNVQDIGRLMQLNRTYCSYLLRDEAWQHIRRRCVQVAPFVEELLFKAFPWRDKEYNDEQGARKKARLRLSDKKPYKFPVGGVWYVLKTFVMKARDAISLRKFLRYRKNGIPPVFLPFSHYDFTEDHIFVGSERPLDLNFTNTELRDNARVVVIAFAFRLQHPVPLGTIHWEDGILTYKSVLEGVASKTLSYIHRRLGLWRGTWSSWEAKTLGFKTVFYF